MAYTETVYTNNLGTVRVETNHGRYDERVASVYLHDPKGYTHGIATVELRERFGERSVTVNWSAWGSVSLADAGVFLVGFEKARAIAVEWEREIGAAS
jgi:hypothetical protein